MDIYILKDGSKLGPYSESHVRGLLSSATVSHQDMGWCEGLQDWIPLSLIVVGSEPAAQIPVPFQGGQTIKKDTFRVFVVLTIGAFIASLVATTMDSSSASAPEATTYNYVLWGLFLLSLIVQAISYIGLLLLKKWGRVLFTATTVVLTLLCFSQGTLSESAASNGLSSIWEILCGVIIALSYFTPLFDVSGGLKNGGTK